MTMDIVVPALGESISEATVLNWRKGPGEPVSRHEVLVELETDKVTVEVEAPEDGVLLEITASDGDDVAVGAVIGRVRAADAAKPADRPGAASGAAPADGESGSGERGEASPAPDVRAAPAASPDPAPAAGGPAGPADAPAAVTEPSPAARSTGAPAKGQSLAADPADPGTEAGKRAAPSDLPDPTQVRRSGPGERITADDLREFLGALDRPLSPSVRRIVREHGVDPATVAPTGPGGRILQEDVPVPDPVPAAGRPLAERGPGTGQPAASSAAADAPAVRAPAGDEPVAAAPEATAGGATREAAEPDASRRAADPDAGRVRRVPMSRLRRRLAERLKEAQHTAATLTTYNEVDMGAVMALRKTSGDSFRQRHGVRLGLMSFFVKASVSALRTVPELNAEIDGTEIVYKDYFHVAVAVQSERGLVVPVIRDADRKGFADIEREILGFSERASAGSLAADELRGGTFTVSNGGVYGSLMSAPILNLPQSGILGLHRIQERPVARDGQVVIRPMMYLALSYDHRIVDGKGAVTFLVHLRDQLEQPAMLALDT